MMEDIGQKISNLLSNPDGLDKLKSLAEGLLSDNTDKISEAETRCSDENSLSNNILNNMNNINGIMRLASLLNQEQRDTRIELLRALKPHLSTERAKKVDKAISILKIAAILPVLREEGLLDAFGFGF